MLVQVFFTKVIYEIIPIFRRFFGIVKGEWEERIFPKANIKERRKLFWWSRVLVLGHLTLAVIFILTGQWILLLLITFAVFFGQWLTFICAFAQHAGLQPDVNDFRLCCRTVKMNPIFGYLYWQMHYHVEHHMYAGVPFYNLKKLNKVIGYDLPKAKTLIPAWKEIILSLRKQKQDAGYFHTPELPQRVEC